MDLNTERRCSMKEICEYLGISRDTVLTWSEERQKAFEDTLAVILEQYDDTAKL